MPTDADTATADAAGRGASRGAPPPPPPPSPSATRPPARPVGPRGRRAWRVLGSIAVVILVAYAIALTVSLLAHETDAYDLSFAAGEVDTVDIDVDAGRVRVVATDGDTVEVSVRVDRGLRDTRDRQDLADGTLTLTGSCPISLTGSCAVDYLVEVPRRVDVRARSGHDDVVVVGVDGSVEARSDDGDVLVEGGDADRLVLASGDGSVRAVDVRAAELTASTADGAIEVVMLAAPRQVDVSSAGGSIEIVVPDDDAAYRVELRTGNGDRTAAVRTDPASSRAITADTDNGDVTVRYPA